MWLPLVGRNEVDNRFPHQRPEITLFKKNSIAGQVSLLWYSVLTPVSTLAATATLLQHWAIEVGVHSLGAVSVCPYENTAKPGGPKSLSY